MEARIEATKLPEALEGVLNHEQQRKLKIIQYETEREERQRQARALIQLLKKKKLEVMH